VIDPLLQDDEDDEAGAPDDRLSTALTTLKASDSWTDGTEQSFGGISWRPDLEMDGAVLHVHLADRLRPYVVRRLESAFSAGMEVHVACELNALYDDATLGDLVKVDPVIHVLNLTPTANVERAAGLLATLADRGIQVTVDTRKLLGREGLLLARASGTAPQRGRRFESLLVFMFSQVEHLDVVERNYRTETEELDAVIQLRATGGRIWATLGAPLILLEAKNWADPVPQAQVSAFRVKIQGRRGTVRIGFLIGASGFTSDALMQEIRFSAGDITIACLDLEAVEKWIDSEDPSDFLEVEVRRAMLR
jgi:Restriction endonuclease